MYCFYKPGWQCLNVKNHEHQIPKTVIRIHSTRDALITKRTTEHLTVTCTWILIFSKPACMLCVHFKTLFQIPISTCDKWYFHLFITLFSTCPMSELSRVPPDVANTTMMAKLPTGPVHHGSFIGYSSGYPSRREASFCNGGSRIPQLHSTLLNDHTEVNGKVPSQFKTSFSKHSCFKPGRYMYMSAKSNFCVCMYLKVVVW